MKSLKPPENVFGNLWIGSRHLWEKVAVYDSKVFTDFVGHAAGRRVASVFLPLFF